MYLLLTFSMLDPLTSLLHLDARPLRVVYVKGDQKLPAADELYLRLNGLGMLRDRLGHEVLADRMTFILLPEKKNRPKTIHLYPNKRVSQKTIAQVIKKIRS